MELKTKGSKSAGNVRVKGTKISLIFIALLYLASLLSVDKYNQTSRVSTCPKTEHVTQELPSDSFFVEIFKSIHARNALSC